MKTSLRIQVAIFTLTRIILNTTIRMVYPFINVFGRGLGVELAQVARALSWRYILGLFSPFLASVADSRGRRTGMLVGMVSFSLGLSVVVIWPIYEGFAAALAFATLGKVIFDSSMRAYIGDRVPYARRGSTLAITEYGWSGAFFLGMPVVGFLVGRMGWLAPFPLLIGMGFVSLVCLYFILPKDAPEGKQRPNLLINFGAVINSRAALAGLALMTFVILGGEMINLVFGDWLEISFGLQVLALGGSAAMIGAAELLGDSGVALITDRIGNQRAIAIGLVVNSLVVLLLPVIGKHVVGAFIGLFLFYLSFEFSAVSEMPLMTEILPHARATLIGLMVASDALGRLLGVWIVPTVYEFGFQACTVGSVIFNVLALVTLRWVRVGE